MRMRRPASPAPDRRVTLEVGRGDHALAFGEELEQRVRNRPRIDRRGALVAHELERSHEARLLQDIVLSEQFAAGGVHRTALAHRHHRREHHEARDVSRGHRDA